MLERTQPGDMTLTVLLAVRSADRAKEIAAILRNDRYTVILAHDATSAVNLAWQHKPDAIVFDPHLTGAEGAELARRLRRAGLGEAVAILALGDRTASPEPQKEIDYQLPMSFEAPQLSGLIHYVRAMRRKQA